MSRPKTVVDDIDKGLGLIESGMIMIDRQWKHLTEDEVRLLEWSFERLAADNVKKLRSAFKAMQEVPADE